MVEVIVVFFEFWEMFGFEVFEDFHGCYVIHYNENVQRQQIFYDTQAIKKARIHYLYTTCTNYFLNWR